jgi:hypothetical protein
MVLAPLLQSCHLLSGIQEIPLPVGFVNLERRDHHNFVSPWKSLRPFSSAIKSWKSYVKGSNL